MFRELKRSCKKSRSSPCKGNTAVTMLVRHRWSYTTNELGSFYHNAY
nr:MAG TPA: hypothetical protein [Bacteriophage sp.]